MLGQGKLARTGKSDSEIFWPRQSLENILILLNGKGYACTSGEGRGGWVVRWSWVNFQCWGVLQFG